MPSNTVSRLAHHDQRINTTASKSSVLHCTEMAPATVPKLPLEILLMIADHLPGSTLSSLSRTCRALHHLLRQALDKYFSLNAPRIFRWAAICNLVAPVQRCLALGTPLPEFRRHTVLGILAQQGCNDVARILLLRGADPNAMDRWGLTPLCRAVTTRNLALARILLEHGAKVEVKNGRCYGSTVVEVARRAKDKEMEELLGSFGAVVQDSLRVGEAIEWWL